MLSRPRKRPLPRTSTAAGQLESYDNDAEALDPAYVSSWIFYVLNTHWETIEHLTTEVRARKWSRGRWMMTHLQLTARRRKSMLQCMS